MPLDVVRETSAVLLGLKLQVSPLYCQPLVPVQQTLAPLSWNPLTRKPS